MSRSVLTHSPRHVWSRLTFDVRQNMKTQPIKEGTWLYGGTSPVLVRIEQTNVKPGSGDYEDPDDVREDRNGDFFRIVYSAAGESWMQNERGYFETLSEALREAERAFPGIKMK